VTNFTAFEDTVNALVQETELSVGFFGITSSVVSSAMGNLTLSGIPFFTDVLIPGMNNFLDPPIRLDAVDVSNGWENVLGLNLTLGIYAPSFASMAAPLLPVLVQYNQVVIGNASTSPLQLQGDVWNEEVSVTYLNDVNEETSGAITEFLSAYMGGQNVTITITGNPDAMPIQVLKKAISNFKTVCTAPGINGLINYAKLSISFINFFRGYMEVELTVTNPWSAPLQLTGVTIGVYLNGTHIGQINELPSVIPLPSKQTVHTPILDVKAVDITWAEIEGEQKEKKKIHSSCFEYFVELFLFFFFSSLQHCLELFMLK
jgi:LEA14-like dessication related protein